MSDTTHHHRREHIRENPSGTISPVSETVVKNTGPRTGLSRHEVADQHDGLIGLINAEDEMVDGIEEAEEVAYELTNEEKSANASLLNRLMGHDVVDSLGNPLDEEAAKLLTIKSLIETLEISLQDDGDVDDIVFALESSDWSSNGFNRKEHLPWAALGLNAEDAARWRDNDFTPFTVGNWTSNRYYGRIEPEDAKFYEKAGISVDEARNWSHRSFAGENAVGWIKAGVDIYEASRWNSAGVEGVQEHKDWIALGVTESQDVAVLKRLGDDAANRWIAADVDLYSATSWNGLVKPGYTEKDLAPFASKEVSLSPGVIEKWQEEKIPASEIAEFMNKGYTPKRAQSRIKKGQNAAQSEDLRGKEVVPGKAWKEFKTAIKDSSSKLGFTATQSEQRNSDGTVTVRVDMEPPLLADGSYGGRPRRYVFKFTNTGRFLSADGTGVWRGVVRKVSDMTSIISDY